MPTNVKIKVCGLVAQSNISEVASTGPDYMGFIFYRKSPRYVGSSLIIPDLPKKIKKVGVFVNEQTDVILDAVKKHQLDLVQLHGAEPPEQCKELRETVKVIKVFAVGEELFDFTQLEPFKVHVDYFLFDTKGKQAGGNGFAFDWKILSNYDQQVPFFLSGGINENNVKATKDLSGMNIHALDINSGVEDRPGLKSVNKINKLLTNLR